MVTKIELSLTCEIRNTKDAKNRPGSILTIMAGGMIVASAMKGGRWSQTDALKEFRRLPQTFKKGPGWDLYENKLVA